MKNLRLYKKNAKLFCIFLLIAVVLEVVVFNYRSLESKFFQPIDNYDVTLGSEIEKKSENSFVISGLNQAYIELNNIDDKINNIYLDIEGESSSYDIEISVTDEANELYYSMPSRTVLYQVQDSKYIRLHTSGNSKKLKISFLTGDGEKIKIHGLKLNEKVPLQTSWQRIMIILLIESIIFLFRPNSFLWKKKVSEQSNIANSIILLYILLQISLFWFMSSINPWILNNEKALINHVQYWNLTEAILDGKEYIDFDGYTELKDMENPYDWKLRTEEQIDAPWDYAFYNDKFYVYFGIVPVLLIYIPWYLITGNMILNHHVIMILIPFFIVGILLLLKEVINRFFTKTSYALYLMMTAICINGCGVLYFAKRPDFYSIPILFGLVFTIFGLLFWIKAIDDRKICNKKYLLFGSICMALVAGCRPQLLLGSFLILPLIKDILIDKFQNRKALNIKNTVLEVACILIPYACIAAALMYYNFIRFGSVFDFGANYNLTSNDMTKRGWVWDRTGLGLFVYLFQPPTIISQFPFLSVSNLSNDYQGITIYEKLFGGLLASNLILYLGCFSFKLKNLFKEKKLYYFNIMSITFGFIIVVVDTQMAGLLIRYVGDFGIFFFLPTIVVIFVLMEKLNLTNAYKYIQIFIICMVCSSLLYNGLLIFVDDPQSYKEFCPVLYYKIAYAIQFWL